jgi:hypothetical protein
VGKAKSIEPRTLWFVGLHAKLKKENKMITHAKLANLLGFKGKQSITEIIKLRSNIDQKQWEVFKDYFNVDEKDLSTEYNVQKSKKSTENTVQDIDYKEKYYKHLEKENKAKDRTIDKLSLAVDNIKVVDDKVERLKVTVDAHASKWKDYEPTILGLREFVTGEIAALKKKSHEEVAAALDIKVEEQRKKVELSYTQKG